MALGSRIESLSAKHAALEALLASEEAHPWQNELRVLRLKKDKLRIKDEIQRLRLVAANGDERDDRASRSS